MSPIANSIFLPPGRISCETERCSGALMHLLVGQRFHARQLAPFEEFERGAAAGRDVRDLFGYAGLVHRRKREAAADNRRRINVSCDGFSVLCSTAGEWLAFNHY